MFRPPRASSGTPRYSVLIFLKKVDRAETWEVLGNIVFVFQGFEHFDGCIIT